MSPSTPSLVVVRGSSRYADPTFRCATNGESQKSQYAMLTVEDGRVTQRTVTPSRQAVEQAMQSFRGTVHVDARKDAGLMPLSAPPRAHAADLASLRRAKSDVELDALHALSERTHRGLRAANVTASSFRGAAEKDQLKSSFEVTKRAGFTQYRGGVQNAKGLCSDLTRVVPHTDEWKARLARVDRGLDAVFRGLKVGARVAELDRTFLAHLDPDKDRVYGSVVHHTGFESHETDTPLERLEKYDFVTVGAAVGGPGGARDTALIYRGSRAMDDDRMYGRVATGARAYRALPEALPEAVPLPPPGLVSSDVEDAAQQPLPPSVASTIDSSGSDPAWLAEAAADVTRPVADADFDPVAYEQIINDQRARMNELIEELKRYPNENEELKYQVRQVMSEYEDLQRQFEAKQRVNDEDSEQLRRLMQQNRWMTTELQRLKAATETCKQARTDDLEALEALRMAMFPGQSTSGVKTES